MCAFGISVVLAVETAAPTACAAAVCTGQFALAMDAEGVEDDGCMQVTVVLGLRQGGGGKVAVAGWVGSSSSSDFDCHFFFSFLVFIVVFLQLEEP